MFDRMSKTYGVANYITSFGFTERWRRQCLEDLPPVPANAQGYDLMSGMGEAWEHILKQVPQGKITAIDLSSSMHKKAEEKSKALGAAITAQQADILNNDLPDSSAQFVVSTFGLKTFKEGQLRQLAQEVARILQKGGVFSFIEISSPKGWLLKPFYLFYLKIVIPLIGRLFLGNARDYRMLGQYCQAFGDCQAFQKNLESEGLEVHFKKYFFGCATGVYGRKPS